MRTFSSVQELAGAVGERLGPTDWVTVTQEQVDQFAQATGDHQWIHVDPERAKDGPFGGTIAHGYLTLSLLPVLSKQLYAVEGVKMGINYGLNRLRFPTPVPVGSRVRSSAVIDEVADVGGGAVQLVLTTTVEVDGSAKPAVVAENVVRYVL